MDHHQIWHDTSFDQYLGWDSFWGFSETRWPPAIVIFYVILPVNFLLKSSHIPTFKAAFAFQPMHLYCRFLERNFSALSIYLLLDRKLTLILMNFEECYHFHDATCCVAITLFVACVSIKTSTVIEAINKFPKVCHPLSEPLVC